jgi:hypothetical protein
MTEWYKVRDDGNNEWLIVQELAHGVRRVYARAQNKKDAARIADALAIHAAERSAEH